MQKDFEKYPGMKEFITATKENNSNLNTELKKLKKQQPSTYNHVITIPLVQKILQSQNI